MQVDFSNNYFELFELAIEFDLPVAKLESRFMALQKYLHPDNFAASADAERRWSVQAASFVNEAYQSLLSPLKRATYMLSLQGIELNEETDTQMAPAFLMQQMEWREALDDVSRQADPFVALEKINAEIADAQVQSSNAFSAAVEQQDWVEARTVVRQWQFLDKMKAEIRTQEARLDEID